MDEEVLVVVSVAVGVDVNGEVIEWKTLEALSIARFAMVANALAVHLWLMIRPQECRASKARAESPFAFR